MRIDAFLAVLYFCPWKSQEQINIETKGKCLRSCSATCKLLCISCLAEIRVVVFTTLKMPKALIVSVIRVARPGGSKPPPSLGVRPKLAKRGRGSLQPFCASASDQTSEMLILHRENFLQLGTPCEIVAKLRACLWRRLLRCFAIRLRRPRSSLFRKLRTRPSAG